jgi:hypothetical protein
LTFSPVWSGACFSIPDHRITFSGSCAADSLSFCQTAFFLLFTPSAVG